MKRVKIFCRSREREGKFRLTRVSPNWRVIESSIRVAIPAHLPSYPSCKLSYSYRLTRLSPNCWEIESTIMVIVCTPAKLSELQIKLQLPTYTAVTKLLGDRSVHLASYPSCKLSYSYRLTRLSPNCWEIESTIMVIVCTPGKLSELQIKLQLPTYTAVTKLLVDRENDSSGNPCIRAKLSELQGNATKHIVGRNYYVHVETHFLPVITTVVILFTVLKLCNCIE
ncbi:hypothetical protein J6590_030699 [Homalodisca vitripennis]|nr:hypothetical protein J6590_030699 [Homalodisca vitripennis]